MANINKQITLTTKENSAGPYFDVYYSTDCINYTICIDGSGVYLPNINSTGIVTVPDNTICIKLVNKNANCGSNEYIDQFGTTTTTTAGPTTTTAGPTTTTTAAPTTTTTTAEFTCFNWNSSRCNAPGDCVIQYTDCSNNPVTQSVNYEQAVTVCSPNAPTVTQGTMNTFNNIGGCGYLPTTTTTTTAAPTTTTTTLQSFYGLIKCGESAVDYYTATPMSSGEFMYSGGGFCYVSTGNIGQNISGKTEIFGSVGGCTC